MALARNFEATETVTSTVNMRVGSHIDDSYENTAVLYRF